MVRAIDEYQISGVQTTLPFCRFVMEHEAFRSGNFDTHFVKHHFTPEVLKTEPKTNETQIAAVLVAHLLHQNKKPVGGAATVEVQKSKWKANRVR